MSKKYPCFELSKSVHILNCQEILKLDEQKVSIFWTFKKFED